MALNLQRGVNRGQLDKSAVLYATAGVRLNRL
jgi:hypothetical protein